ncbi:MAG: peroxiredoxin family protein, partial [Muribaculaceae bacterium]|nr:peroxiredoxin family protein [Muribaculaceae bacterium]
GLDSVEIKKSGSYSMLSIAPPDPEIYRLRLGEGYVYFPVDSVETITIDAPADRFATDFSISGSDQAEAMGRFEKELIAASRHLSNPDSANNFKRHVFTTYLKDARGSVMSYYILTKTVDGAPLFSVPEDTRYFAAVATAIREYRPDDPRLEMLTRTATSARRTVPSDSTRRRVMEAAEISFIDINLPSTDGKDVRLSQVAGKGQPTVLIFSDLSNPDTPALNAELRKLSGVKIYNVGFDDDQLQWRNAAANLPWICVYANDSEASRLVGSYNIGALPTIYVLDAAGNLKARCASLDELRRHI